jgi:hypothetical protein
MDTNYLESTEYTEKTECLADVGHTADDFVPSIACKMKSIRLASVCLAVSMRFAERERCHAEAFKLLIIASID